MRGIEGAAESAAKQSTVALAAADAALKSAQARVGRLKVTLKNQQALLGAARAWAALCQERAEFVGAQNRQARVQLKHARGLLDQFLVSPSP